MSDNNYKTYSWVIPHDLSDAEELNLIEALKLKKVSSIKSWVTFFGVLGVIG